MASLSPSKPPSLSRTFSHNACSASLHLPEAKARLPANALRLNQTSQLAGLMTLIRDKNVSLSRRTLCQRVMLRPFIFM